MKNVTRTPRISAMSDLVSLLATSSATWEGSNDLHLLWMNFYRKRRLRVRPIKHAIEMKTKPAISWSALSLNSISRWRPTKVIIEGE